MSHRTASRPLWSIGLLAFGLGCSPDLPTDPAPGDDKTEAGDPNSSATDGDHDDVDDTAETGTSADNDNDNGRECVPGVGDCAEGLKCQPYVKEDGACCVDADMCVPVAGDRQFGDTCTRERYGDDCARDLFCYAGTSGKEGAGYCRQLCDGESKSSCTALGLVEHVCLPYNEGHLPMCERTCHPLRPNCIEGEGCYPFGDWFFCAWHDTSQDPPGGWGQQGDDCYHQSDCDPGYACVPIDNYPSCESDACCGKYCDLSDGGGSCDDGLECVAWFGPGDTPGPGLETVGTCVPRP